MKQRFLHILLIALLVMNYPFQTSGKVKAVDFNYPQDVSKEALADLENALKIGDGQQTVNALVRYSIAQSGISSDNMPDIVNRLESVIQKERQPHIRALLNYFEAIVDDNYCSRFAWGRKRLNPDDETPTDISEWDRAQFERKIIELANKSLADIELLKQVPVTSLPDILVYNELGVTYIPTMQEFMSIKCLDLLKGIDDAAPLCSIIRERWLNETEGNVPAHIYAMTNTGKSVTADDYKKYQDSEFCALLLKNLYFPERKDRYQALKDYVKRFPKSPFTPEIANEITDIESMSVSLSYPKIRSSRDSIPVSINVENANSFNIVVYRLTESALRDAYRLNWDGAKVVMTIPVTVPGTIPFHEYNIKKSLPPLPYGLYILSPPFIFLIRKSEKLYYIILSFSSGYICGVFFIKSFFLKPIVYYLDQY